MPFYLQLLQTQAKILKYLHPLDVVKIIIYFLSRACSILDKA